MLRFIRTDLNDIMTIRLKYIVAVIITIFLVIGFAYNSSAKEVTYLPRTFGSLFLGMTVEKFYSITRVQPEFCHQCREDEFHAGITVNDHPKIFPLYYRKLPKWQQGIDVLFYSGNLYQIDTFPEIRNIKVAQEKYVALYGNPIRIENWENGISWVIWEDVKTRISLAYVKKKGNSYPLNLPLGTVIKLKFLDIEIFNNLEEKQKKTLENH